MDIQRHSQIKILSPSKLFVFDNKWYYEMAQPSHFWVRGRFRNLVHAIDRLDISTENCLKGMEIGCGNGVVRAQLESVYPWVVDGSDLDLHGLQMAKTGRGELYLYDILEKDPVFKESYDFLVLFDVLEHIHDVNSFLSACLFHLRKGGYLFVNVPALPNLFSVYDQVQGHQRRYDLPALRRLFLENDLRVLDIHYWGMCLVPLVVLRKFLTNRAEPPEAVIRKGFKPPGEFINSILKILLDAELRVISRPWVGTSVFAVVQKV